MVSFCSLRRFRLVVAVATLSVLSACSSAAGSPTAAGSASGSVYVCVFAYPSQPGTRLARIDLTDRRTVTPLDTTVSEPAAMAVVGRSGDLVVVGTGDDQLVVVDPATGHIERRVVVGLEPAAVAVTADGTRAVVADSGSGQLRAVDLRTGAVTGSVSVGSVPDAVAIGGPHGTLAVVADEAQDAVVLVNLRTLQPGPTISVGSEPVAVAITPDGTTALVANFGSDTLTPVNLVTAAAGLPIALPVPPTGLAVSPLPAPGTTTTSDPDGTAWVSGGGSLVPIDLATMAAGSPIAVGHPTEAVALSDGGRHAWVADEDARVTTIDLVNGRVGPTLYVGGRPSAIVVDQHA